MMRGFWTFASGCAVVAGLTLIPPEHARWIAIALLVLVALTPAIGRRGPVQPVAEEAGELKIGERASGSR